MKRNMITALIPLLLLYGILYARDFSGTYGFYEDGENIILTLTQDAQGSVTGTMSAEGMKYSIQGQKKGDRIIGFMAAFDESLKFTIRFSHNNLLVTLLDPEDVQSGYNDASETLMFQPLDLKAAKRQNKPSIPERSKSNETHGKNKVIINGIVLSEKQIAELGKMYNIKPLPGNYWYDTQSGLYGVMGYPAYGFMRAGHGYGKLQRSASNGNTGVFVNGRELPASEWAVWSQLLGYRIPQGRYWLDGNGNAGYEGNPIPTVNLYAAAQRNSSSGSGQGGDNFWSSRFSAGNYDSGNQRGYVSVPGYGPVGYGF